MTEVEPVLDFASSGRSGRRNALPDILGSPAGVNPGDLPLKLAELNLKGEAEGLGAGVKLRKAQQTRFLSSFVHRWSWRGPVALGGGSSSAAGELGGEGGLVGTPPVASGRNRPT